MLTEYLTYKCSYSVSVLKTLGACHKAKTKLNCCNVFSAMVFLWCWERSVLSTFQHTTVPDCTVGGISYKSCEFAAYPFRCMARVYVLMLLMSGAGEAFPLDSQESWWRNFAFVTVGNLNSDSSRPDKFLCCSFCPESPFSSFSSHTFFFLLSCLRSPSVGHLHRLSVAQGHSSFFCPALSFLLPSLCACAGLPLV